MFYKFMAAAVLCFSATIALADDCITDQYGIRICTNARSKTFEFTGTSLYNLPETYAIQGRKYPVCAGRERFPSWCYLDGSDIILSSDSQGMDMYLMTLNLMNSFVSASGKVKIVANLEYDYDRSACTNMSSLLFLWLEIYDGGSVVYPTIFYCGQQAVVMSRTIEWNKRQEISFSVARRTPPTGYNGLIRIKKLFLEISDQ